MPWMFMMMYSYGTNNLALQAFIVSKMYTNLAVNMK